MKKKLVFLFFVVTSIVVTVLFFAYSQFKYEKITAQEEILPLVANKMVVLNNFEWRVPFDFSVKKPVFMSYKTVKQNEMKPSRAHISVGGCAVSPFSAVHLDQKMQKGAFSRKTLPMGNIDCGLIRTSIPFSF